MTLATRLHFGKVQEPRKSCWYGPHGIGKSTLAAAAPAPVFIATEQGLNNIDCAKFTFDDGARKHCESLEEFYQCLRDLHSLPHDRQSVVVDSIDWLERLIHKDVCAKKGGNCTSIEDIGYGKGYVFALNQWDNVLSGLESLRRRGLWVVLLAHAKVEKFDNPATDSYDRYSPKLHKTASHLVQEWCDEVFFCNYKVYTTETDQGFNRKSIKGASSGERVIYTAERPSHVAKNRLNLPLEMPFSWSAYMAGVAASSSPPAVVA